MVIKNKSIIRITQSGINEIVESNTVETAIAPLITQIVCYKKCCNCCNIGKIYHNRFCK